MGRTVFLITRTTRYQNDKTVLKKKRRKGNNNMKKAERHRENRTDDERATDETHGRLDYRNAAVAEFCALRRRGKKRDLPFW